jgi:3-dehydroquinate synthase
MEPEFLASIRPRASEETPIFIGQGAVTEGDFVTRLLRERRHSRHILLSDERVYELHGRRLESRLCAEGLSLNVCVVPPAETSKSTRVYLRLADRILKAGIDKESILVTLGGGMINNLGGFLAATLYRGIGLIHLPTSLMAQLDAAVDLRQAVNLPFGKNLLGCFYPPRAIVVDPRLLKTLPVKHLRSGAAEAVKHALTQRPRFFRFLVGNAHKLREPAFLEAVVRETIRLKLSLLNASNYARHGEFLLQYGHCIGHALETATDYSLLHGEAIAVGMAVSSEIALAARVCGAESVESHRLILGRYGLPVSVPRRVSIEAVLEAVSYDKNIRRGAPRLALLRNVGRVYKAKEGSFAYVGRDVLRDSLLKSRGSASGRKGACA